MYHFGGWWFQLCSSYYLEGILLFFPYMGWSFFPNSKGLYTHYNWVVVSNMFYVHPRKLGEIKIRFDGRIFFKWVKTINQLCCFMSTNKKRMLCFLGGRIVTVRVCYFLQLFPIVFFGKFKGGNLGQPVHQMCKVNFGCEVEVLGGSSLKDHQVSSGIIRYLLLMVQKSCTSWYGKYPTFFRVLYIPGGCLGFLNHQK